MKTKLRTIIFLAVLMTSLVWAQAPQKFNYQGVARNAMGNPLASTGIGLQLSITDGFTTLYSESFSTNTNTLGLFTVEVGNGSVVSGTFSAIDWLSGSKYLKVEMDPAGGTSYTDMGTSQLLSVPYALVAEKVTSFPIGDLSDVSNATPVTNQVLQWDGTQWVPANISSGGGDNWGSQTAFTGTDLTGNGTSGSPLTLASQGASTGQVLRWNGGAWVPSTITGDNWGSQTVSASTQFGGNGTSGNPLILAQQGAASGDVLKWSGTNWVPGADNVGSFTLPYTGSTSSGSPGIFVTNTGIGSGLKGTNSSTDVGAIGVQGTTTNPAGGSQSAGVAGVNNSTNNNGFGVYAYHASGGTGVYGQANTGTGVYGTAGGATGVGILGLGHIGVKGNSNTATGIGVWGNAIGGGYAGWFDGKTVINSNSGVDPNLLIQETENFDYARLKFSNTTPGQFWEINCINNPVSTNEQFNIWNGANGALLTVRGDGNVGLGNTNPSQRLDVAGNVKFSGALMPNNVAGNTGQVLISQGSGTAPVWGSSTNTLFNNTYLWDQSNSFSLLTADQAIYFGGFQDLNFTISGPSVVLINFSETQIYNGSGGGGNAQAIFKIQLKDNLNNVINQAWVYEVIENNKTGNVSYTHHCFLSTPGTYKINVLTNLGGSDPDVTIQAPAGGYSTGQVNLQVIPQ